MSAKHISKTGSFANDYFGVGDLPTSRSFQQEGDCKYVEHIFGKARLLRNHIHAANTRRRGNLRFRNALFQRF